MTRQDKKFIKELAEIASSGSRAMRKAKTPRQRQQALLNAKNKIDRKAKKALSRSFVFYIIIFIAIGGGFLLFIGEGSLTEGNQIHSCGELTTRLEIGDSGSVYQSSPLPSRVRNGPGLSTVTIGGIQPGESFRVLDGPVCRDDILWWYVDPTNGPTGWTAEGENGIYFVIPR